jgi:hypothetical protein
VVVASFFGDTWRLSAAVVVMLGIVGFWYFVISRLGSMQILADPERMVAAARAETEPHLVHPRFARMERVSVRVLVGVNVVMLIQMLLFMPYFVHRFGWSK